MQLFIWILVAVILLLILLSNIKIVPQSYVFIVERLGIYHASWGVGPHFRVPFIEKIVRIITLKEQVEDFKPQPVITKDNVTMHIDTVIYYQIVDPKMFTYGVDRPLSAIENLTATSLRNIIGDMELDETLTSRDEINSLMLTILDEATNVWGIKINRVELKNIVPPREIQDAMEKQMKAERERREQILRAEGEKKSAILVAEGRKEAAILTAEAERESAILSAQGRKQTHILEAEGQAEAIVKIQSATAEGIKKINASTPSVQALALKSMETFEKVADGKATKIIVPTNLQEMAGITTTFKEFMTDTNIPSVEPPKISVNPQPQSGSAIVAKKLAEAEAASTRKGLGRLEGRFGLSTGGKSGDSGGTGGKGDSK
jgi:regulator of protease activity HflC (stomatin/prohibitin superfamily)